MQKTHKHSPETKEKLRIVALTRDDTNRLASLPKGNKHWRWQEFPNKDILHRRLHRKYGRASIHKCVDCEESARDWSNETGNYTDDIKDYLPRCRSCHIKKDEGWKKNKSENWKKFKRNSKGQFVGA